MQKQGEMLGPGECPILRPRSFHFTVLSILAQLTSDPLSFIWWSPTTKVLNRDQPPMRMKARLCEDVSTGYSDLISRGLVKIEGTFSLAETKSLLISMTLSTESLRRIAGPKVYALVFLPPSPLSLPMKNYLQTISFFWDTGSQWGHLSFTSVTSLGGILKSKRKLTCSFPTKSSASKNVFNRREERKRKTKYWALEFYGLCLIASDWLSQLNCWQLSQIFLAEHPQQQNRLQCLFKALKEWEMDSEMHLVPGRAGHNLIISIW